MFVQVNINCFKRYTYTHTTITDFTIIPFFIEDLQRPPGLTFGAVKQLAKVHPIIIKYLKLTNHNVPIPTPSISLSPSPSTGKLYKLLPSLTIPSLSAKADDITA